MYMHIGKRKIVKHSRILLLLITVVASILLLMSGTPHQSFAASGSTHVPHTLAILQHGNSTMADPGPSSSKAVPHASGGGCNQYSTILVESDNMCISETSGHLI